MMSEQAQPDTGSTAQPRGDAHGQAAYLLVESLIHELIAKNVLRVDEAIQVVSVAADVEDVLRNADETAAPTAAFKLLQTLQASLELER